MEAVELPVVVDVRPRRVDRGRGRGEPDVIIHQLTDLSAADFAAPIGCGSVARELGRCGEGGGRAPHDRAERRDHVRARGELRRASEQDPFADSSPTVRDTVKGVRALEAVVAGEPPRGQSSLRLILRAGRLVFEERVLCRRGWEGERPASSGISSYPVKTPPARRCSQSTAGGWSISSTMSLLPAPNGCRRRGVGPAAALANTAAAKGASNSKARQKLGGEPLYPTWREGLW